MKYECPVCIEKYTDESKFVLHLKQHIQEAEEDLSDCQYELENLEE